MEFAANHPAVTDLHPLAYILPMAFHAFFRYFTLTGTHKTSPGPSSYPVIETGYSIPSFPPERRT